MTEQPNGNRKPAGQFNWLWMILSLIVVSGFLAWLGASSQRDEVAVVEEEVPETTDVSGAVPIALGDLVGGVDQYVNQAVRLEDVAVASPLGGQAFWTTLPNNTPFLVKLGGDVVAGGFSVRAGDVVTVVGRVHMMSDSVLTAWQQQGALQDDGQRMEAEFATAFVEALHAERVGGAEDADAAEDR